MPQLRSSRVPDAGVGFIEPCLPSPAHKPPTGLRWRHEIKHYGYRAMLRSDGRSVWLFTRRSYDWTERAIVGTARALRASR
jgi:ATP-dependent DNA ligase